MSAQQNKQNAQDAYAAFSIYFASVFFPAGNQTAQLLNTAGVFAVGFLVRPLGGRDLERLAQSGRRQCGGDAVVGEQAQRSGSHPDPADAEVEGAPDQLEGRQALASISSTR